MAKGKMYTDDYMIEALKKEINRLGMEDNLGRTEVQKRFKIENMPHPRTYVHRFGSWEKALERAGFKYNGKSIISKSIKKSNTGKRHAATWSNLDKEKVINAMVEEIRKKGIETIGEYREKRNRETSPSDITVRMLTGKNWGEIKKIAWEDRK